MQRLHEADVGGRAIEMGWTVLCLPMRYESDHPLVWVKGPVYETLKLKSGDKVENLTRWGAGDPRTVEGELLFPERFPKKFVDMQEEEMDDYAVSGQNQQSPSPRGGGMTKVELIENVWEAPGGLPQARGWDLASSKKKGSAFTACVKVGLDKETGILYVYDAEMEKKGPGELEEFITKVVSGDAQAVLQSFPKDPAQAGDFQAHHLATSLVGRIFEFTPETGEKVDRFKPVASLVNAGKVRFVTGPWNDKLKNQMKKFPAGKLKDLCDAFSRALMALMMSMPEEDDVPGTPTVISAPNPDERLAVAYRTR
jgi:predicted phage terminase large subunit-like protein